MKICRYKKNDHIGYGIIKDDNILDLAGIDPSLDTDLDIQEFITKFSKNKDTIYDKVANNKIDEKFITEYKYELLLSPIKNPSKIICLGLNYKDHAEESGQRLPKRPMLFSKAPSSIIGPNEQIIIPTTRSRGKFKPIKFTDYEVELAIIMGKKTKQIDEEDIKSGDYIFGYTILNDVSARIEQNKDKQFFRSKSFDTFAPLGPFIVTSDEIGDPLNLKVQGIINGEVRQNSNTSNLNFDVYEIVSFISEGITLNPGDVIGTGTPSGIGGALNPPKTLKPGDNVEMKIEKIGTLINKVSS